MQRKSKSWSIIFCFFLIVTESFGQPFYNILDYGGDNTGNKKSSDAIIKAISEASGKGGGTIFFPAGEYLTGPIHLQSNITLYIDAGARIIFSDDFEDYLPMVESRFEGVDVTNFSPLIYANGAENITIMGRGSLDGSGKEWWLTFFKLIKLGKDTTTQWQELFKENNAGIILPDNPQMMELGFLRPPFIQFMHCKNIRIEGVTIRNSPFWTVNPEFCENVTVEGITILNPPSPNTDGINPSSCRNVHISNCHISVGDDCITIKSGKDEPGRLKNVPAENYTITNCTMLSGHGGVVIGSEMSGGVRKIVISNCVFDGTDRGIRIKSTRGRGGVVEDIQVSNIVAKNIKKEIFMFNLRYSQTKPEPVSERTPRFRNIHISNVTGNAKQICAVKGLEEMPVKDLSFSNIDVNAERGFTIDRAENIRLFNIQMSSEKGPSVSISNSEIILMNGVQNLSPLTDVPVIELDNVKEVFIYNCFQPVVTDIFLKVSGKESNHIFLTNNQQHLTTKLVETSNEVSDKAVVIKK